MGIKSVAKITPELAYGVETTDENGETYLSGGIDGTTPEGSYRAFNPVVDGNGNIVISLQTAQYLEADQYEVIDWIPPVEQPI